MVAANDVTKATSETGNRSSETRVGDGWVDGVMLLMFLEEADSVAIRNRRLAPSRAATAGASIVIKTAECALDRLVYAVQQEPKVAHVELLLLDSDGLEHDKSFFTTYIGANADWRTFDDFYKNRRWRALPVPLGRDAIRCARAVCNDERGAPYSLAQYFSAWSPRIAANFVSTGGSVQSPAHCASLCARIMQTLAVRTATPLPVGLIDHPSTYTPSRLFVEVARANATSEDCIEPKVKIPEHAEPSTPPLRVDTLLRSDEELAGTGASGLCRDVASVARHTVHETIHSDINAKRAVHAQRDLAFCAFRAVRVMTLLRMSHNYGFSSQDSKH